jgi:hypothetical protein
VTGGGLDILARITLDFVAEQTVLGAQEAHGEEDKISREELLTTLNGLHIPTASGALGPFNTDGVDALDAVVPIVNELSRHDTVLTGVLAHVCLDLRVAVIDTVDTRPLGPWVVASTLWGRLRQ